MKSNRKPFGRSITTPPESCEVRSRPFGPMYLPGSRKSSALFTKSPSVACALKRESEYEICVFNLESCEVRSRPFGPMYLPGSRKSSALFTKSPSVACALKRESEYEICVFNLEMKRTGLLTSERKTTCNAL